MKLVQTNSSGPIVLDLMLYKFHGNRLLLNKYYFALFKSLMSRYPSYNLFRGCAIMGDFSLNNLNEAAYR